MTTTSNRTSDHPIARNVERELRFAADLLRTNYARPGRRSSGYGVPEAVAEVTERQTLHRIIAERVLSENGVDLWWSDLVCVTAEDAATAVLAVAARGVDLEAVYGRDWQAVVGLLQAATHMDERQLCLLGYRLSGGDGYSTLYEEAHVYALAHDRAALLDRVLSDVMFAGARGDASPASLHRRLMGVRVLELAAAYYVLLDVVPADIAVRLLEPIRAGLFPNAPKL